jgi:hypothetical protein
MAAHIDSAPSARGVAAMGEERRGEERRGEETRGERERERETQRMLEHGRLRKSNMTFRKTVDYIGIPGLRKQLRMSVTP